MRTLINKKMSSCLLLSLLLVFCPTVLFSQQIIKFKSGKVCEVKILRQSSDTLFYQLISEPEITRGILIAQMDSIYSSRNEYYGKLSSKEMELYEKKINHYRITTAIGGVLGLGGVAIIAAGASMKTEAENPNSWAAPLETAGNTAGKTAAIVAGSLVTLAGITVMIVSSSKLQKYKDKLQNLSVDLKWSPSVKGITLTYKF